MTLGAVALLVAAMAGAVFAFSGATLRDDRAALARLALQPFAGSIVSVRAFGPAGQRIPLIVKGGLLTPRRRLAPGELVAVNVVVRRPQWSSWALGRERRETLTVRAPTAHVIQRWLTVRRGAKAKVRFDTAVSAVSFGARRVRVDGRSLDLPTKTRAGSIEVSAAARPWERFGPPVKVTWFPRAHEPVVLAQPSPGARLGPVTALRLTFSKPISDVLGNRDPTLTPAVRGRWVHTDSHTLTFFPRGFGAPFASNLVVHFPGKLAVTGATGDALRTSRDVTWSVASASFLRMQQLLAGAGYLPLSWTSSGRDTPRTVRAQLDAAISAPVGRFRWRYPHTPRELVALWKPGQPNEITRGAVMTFQQDHGLAVDGIAGAQVWHALLMDTVSGKPAKAGYSYVYVHRAVPQLLTLWHNGHAVLTSPGNTGVPAAPTALGTWPVFEHIPIGRMSGTNPDGSHYDDPGIRWISYFHRGEALHAFNRASFGTPQSLGCVELPLAAAAKLWPYTPIGTLVTIEN
jgi:peptidoglycan hydrolase-like protein with peptidoglycan-binding domain